MSLNNHDILYSHARTAKGELVNARTAEKGQQYYCPYCENEFILRRSGNVGPNTKRPHFAHKSKTPNCSPESFLHATFKEKLYNKIQKHLNTKNDISINWNCDYCGKHHSGNLIKKVTRVEMEYSLEQCRPDIALLEDGEDVIAVIEVIVTHSPSSRTRTFYRDNDIVLIEIRLEDDRDLESIDDKLTEPTSVGTCLNPRCSQCGGVQLEKQMIIAAGECWKCGEEMNVAAVSFSKRAGKLQWKVPHTKRETDICRTHGVLITPYYSKSKREKQISCKCNQCGAITGAHYLKEEFIDPALLGFIEKRTINLGYSCKKCEDHML